MPDVDQVVLFFLEWVTFLYDEGSSDYSVVTKHLHIASHMFRYTTSRSYVAVFYVIFTSSAERVHVGVHL